MSDRNEQCGGLCGSPALIGVALVAALILPVAGFHVAKLLGAKPSGDLSEEAVLRRIQPSAQVTLAGAPAAAAAPAGAAATVGNPGKKTYDAACGACHGSGAAGAPKFGDKAAWAPRLKAGVDGLTASAIKGKGAMPPKGGNTSIPDADIKAAVEYMAAAAR
jgi:cytochrome c5